MTPQTTGKAAGASRTIWRIASRHKPFAQLGNAMLRDERLTLEARGALAFILSFPEDWRFSETWFCANANVGRDKARRIIRELLEHGYCWRRQARQSGGTLGAGEYIFTDEPGHASLAGTTKDNITWPTVDASAADGKPVTENPTPANPTQTNNMKNEHYTEHAGGAHARPLPVVLKMGRSDLADRALELFNGIAARCSLATCDDLTVRRRNWLNKRVKDIGGLKNFELALPEIPFDDWLMGRVLHNGKLFQLTLDRLLYSGGDTGDRLANLFDRATERAHAKPRPDQNTDPSL